LGNGVVGAFAVEITGYRIGMTTHLHTPEQTHHRRTFFGHPWGLANLFGIELWERFSFYGMQGILIFYLYYDAARGGLGLPQESATSLVGAYGGLVYLSAVAGAWVADRLIGAERTLFYSGLLILAGHLALAILPGLAGVAVGLACVGLGSGGLKANATSILGSLYDDGDERRDGGFSIFYMGVNIGAFFGPILTGYALAVAGFHVGFALAAVGMALGLGQYVLGRRNLSAAGREVPNPLERSAAPKAAGLVVLGLALVVAAFWSGLVTLANLATVVVVVIAVVAVVLFTVVLRSHKITPTERSRVWSFVPMFVASFAFFSLFQQIFTVIAVYADKRVNLDVGGFHVPPTWFQSVDPIGIMILAPIFALAWTRLGDRQPTTPAKFAIGLGGMGVAFLLFLTMAGGHGRTSPAWAVAVILLLFAVAEMFLSPIGLSLSTRLAPHAFHTQMVALNYLSVAAGTATAGALAGLYSPDAEVAYFGIIGAVGVVLAIALALSKPLVLRLMQGVR
jgi:POT family proton-dependent oligopeptide transporter